VRKLRLVRAALRLREELPEAFAGSYEPLDAGSRAIGYVRGGSVLVLAELFPGGADAVVDLPAGSWRDALNGGTYERAGRVRLAELLNDRPIALLMH
jgi:(1->4)-alpha-D-glucan 1-alpha-D-glucosylmutase